MSSLSFGARAPQIPHLSVLGKNGLLGEVADLRADVESAFVASESREDFPIIDSFPVIDVSNILGGDAFVLTGRNFLQDATQASIDVASTTDVLRITANRPGVGGNDITVTIVNSGSGGQAVTENAGAIEIDLGGDTALDADLINAINSNTAAGLLVTAEIVGSAGAGVLSTLPATSLLGGTGEDFVLEVAGLAQSIDGLVTDTSVPGLIDDNSGTPIAVGNMHSVRVVANGREAMAYSVAVT